MLVRVCAVARDMQPRDADALLIVPARLGDHVSTDLTVDKSCGFQPKCAAPAEIAHHDGTRKLSEAVDPAWDIWPDHERRSLLLQKSKVATA